MEQPGSYGIPTMLERPGIQNNAIVACLREGYGLAVEGRGETSFAPTFLPWGADENTAVFRIDVQGQEPYFLKLRRGPFDELSVLLPKFLSDQGIGQVIPPLATRSGALWCDLPPFQAVLYPFVEGRNAYQLSLSERQWAQLGSALKRIHATTLPPELASNIRQEDYSPKWREMVWAFLEGVRNRGYNEPVAAQVAALLNARRKQIGDLVRRAEGLARQLRTLSLPRVLCHSDLHAGNIHVNASGALYLVDWDEPILAPRERDLMYVGGGLMGRWRPPQEEEVLFYPAYGPTPIDATALAYYRYERIVQDIAAYCQQLLLTDEGGADREQSLHYLDSSFQPNGVLDIAYRSDGTSTAFAQSQAHHTA